MRQEFEALTAEPPNSLGPVESIPVRDMSFCLI